MQKFNNKKAFTLIELLIVIAIIGILFIVLVSKVDFATDKAKASGVQTDFRSFQVAMEMVAKENAGFNTFGWDTGDVTKDEAALLTALNNGRAEADKFTDYANIDKDAGDRVRNAYDDGDKNLNGVYDSGETWTGRKVYTETWTSVYTLDNPADATDKSAIFALETAINANLDPKLRIVIDNAGFITMANGAMDPWKTQYTGQYMSNATAETAAIYNNDASMTGVAGDKLDRGAIVIYSYGANQKLGCKEKVVGGIVTVTVSQIDANTPDNNTKGADDYSLSVIYTYKNGYGEVISTTTGFSNNQKTSGGTQLSNGGNLNMDYTMLDGANQEIDVPSTLVFRSSAPVEEFSSFMVNGNTVDPKYYTVTEGSTIVTLDRAYVAQLENGIHTVEIISDAGRKASTELTVDYESFNFTIYGEQFTAKKGWNWADWILSYGISAGDNGIVWIGYDGHPLMEHGYLYYKLDSGELGENQIILGSEKPMFNDLIQEVDYDIDGPV
jgi:prepilin-type N-terminal cleavage/methylation domain-containing protein